MWLGHAPKKKSTTTAERLGFQAAAMRLKMRKMAAALRHERLVAARAQASLRRVEAGEAQRTAAKEIAKVEAAGKRHEAAARGQAAQVKNMATH